MSGSVQEAGSETRRGRALLLAAILLAAALCVVALVTLVGRAPGGAADPRGAASPAVLPVPELVADGAAVHAVPEPDSTEAAAQADAELAHAAGDRESLALTAPPPAPRPPGIIRGRLLGHDGAPYEGTWTLHLTRQRDPSARDGGELTYRMQRGSAYVVDGLELGRWHVLAEFDEQRSETVLAELTPPRPEAWVELALRPTADVIGRLVDEHGEPLEWVPVHLMQMDLLARIDSHTDPSGAFRLDGVLAGQAKLYFGSMESPIVPVRELEVGLPRVELGEIALEGLAWLHISVMDGAGLAVAGAEISGVGSNGGSIEGQTYENGRLFARHLPAGRYRVFARHPTDGSRVNKTLELAAGERASLDLIITR